MRVTVDLEPSRDVTVWVCLMRSLESEGNKLNLVFLPVLTIKRAKKWFWEPGEL